ncbi:lycopene cyclase domain-containing protein [Jatrophihabitans endophyticus]|uniref:Lycopene cyclase domain-containing protein n=1 Tax=Jatrophihabitans endophyticus TaxID=1206085 RepID=A0A1M5L5Y6_9ACTN|nr:lycopene cyclase domain-containing protein [Jatrophihabitans endophyticus]SHG60514.1 lycopene cyclase domain-containing protein [Jatrophihabitans endophyticus]
MHLAYVLILAGCVIGTLPLEFVLRTGVYARWRRLLVAIVPVVVVFGTWDVLAIRARWWHYDPAMITGVTLPGRLPLEELLFFLVIPACSVLTLEAVRARRPHWSIGDESGASA